MFNMMVDVGAAGAAEVVDIAEQLAVGKMLVRVVLDIEDGTYSTVVGFDMGCY